MMQMASAIYYYYCTLFMLLFFFFPLTTFCIIAQLSLFFHFSYVSLFFFQVGVVDIFFFFVLFFFSLICPLRFHCCRFRMYSSLNVHGKKKKKCSAHVLVGFAQSNALIFGSATQIKKGKEKRR